MCVCEYQLVISHRNRKQKAFVLEEVKRHFRSKLVYKPQEHRIQRRDAGIDLILGIHRTAINEFRVQKGCWDRSHTRYTQDCHQ